VALFHFLYIHREQLGIQLQAAHVDHALRPTSMQDAAFVRSLCDAYSVPLHTVRLTPPNEDASEAWARAQRYAFLQSVAQPLQARIATAHTATDQAETVLLNLARGAGVQGAAGIPPVRKNIVRPFLRVERRQIEAYLTLHGLSHVEDETNATDTYARNRVRHSVLPMMEQVHPGAGAALLRFADSMAETAAYLRQQAECLLTQAQQACNARGEPIAWDAEVMRQAPPPVTKYALTHIIKRCAKQEKTALTDEVYAVLCANKGAVCVSSDAVLLVAQGQLRIQPPHLSTSQWEIPFCLGAFRLPDGRTLEIMRVPWPQNEQIINSEKDEKKLLKFWADCDRIQESPSFRTCQPGDRFAPAGRGVTKSLHKLFSETKIPPVQRAASIVLAQDSRVLWVEGFGFADGLCATQDTKWAVTIHVQPCMEEWST
jgi:tRNA(Ile)-lysidine synthase